MANPDGESDCPGSGNGTCMGIAGFDLMSAAGVDAFGFSRCAFTGGVLGQVPGSGCAVEPGEVWGDAGSRSDACTCVEESSWVSSEGVVFPKAG